MTEASKPQLHMKVSQRGNPSIVTVRIDLEKDSDASEAMKLLNSYTIRQQVYDSRYEHGLGDYGMGNAGAPRPVFRDPADRTSLIAYERDFKFSRNA